MYEAVDISTYILTNMNRYIKFLLHLDMFGFCFHFLCFLFFGFCEGNSENSEMEIGNRILLFSLFSICPPQNSENRKHKK